MRITNVKTYVVGNPWKNWVFVKIETDAGITGWSEATMGLSTRPVEAAIHEMRSLFIGADPCRINRLWDDLYKGLFLATGSVPVTAMTALEIGCWDILGKALNAPVHQLLGGKMRDRIRAYANGWYQGPRDPAFFADRAQQVAAMGYTALKFDPFGSAYQYLDRDEERLSLRIVAAVRQAVGDGVDLLIEGHDRFSVSTAVRLGHALAEFRPMWFETPTLSTDIAATAEVARQIPVPVASGERFTTLTEFRELLATGVIDIIQPETLHAGGLIGGRKIAGLAEAHGAAVAPHNAQSPLATLANVHLDATLPNVLIQEVFDDFLAPWARQILHGCPAIRDGYLEVPDRPGLGIEVDEAALAAYPYHEKHFLRLFEAGWERRTGGR
jgi:galactonate dehydratase